GFDYVVPLLEAVLGHEDLLGLEVSTVIPELTMARHEPAMAPLLPKHEASVTDAHERARELAARIAEGAMAAWALAHRSPRWPRRPVAQYRRFAAPGAGPFRFRPLRYGSDGGPSHRPLPVRLRRLAVLSGEGGTERALRAEAPTGSDGCQARAGAAQLPARELHAPLRQVSTGRQPCHSTEALAERGAGHGRCTGQLLDTPGAGHVRMHEFQRGPQPFIGQQAQQPGRQLCLVHACAHH